MRIKRAIRKITMTYNQTTCAKRIDLRAVKKGAHPAEVGALASVFEKSATELKEKLQKCKRAIQIATLNVRTLNRIGQLPELTASPIDHNTDIICIQEHRYTHSEDIKYHDTGNGSLATASKWKNSVNATIGGIGMLIGPWALKSLNSIEKIQPRMMVATFNGNPSETIIFSYSLTNVSELCWAILPCSLHPVIGGDMNAQIGKNVYHKFSLLNSSKSKGQHLTDFTRENRLTCLNTISKVSDRSRGWPEGSLFDSYYTKV